MDRTQHNPSYRTLSVTSGLGPVALRYLRTCTRVHDNESCRPAHLQNYTSVYTNMAARRNLVLKLKNSLKQSIVNWMNALH